MAGRDLQIAAYFSVKFLLLEANFSTRGHRGAERLSGVLDISDVLRQALPLGTVIDYTTPLPCYGSTARRRRLRLNNNDPGKQLESVYVAARA